MMPTSPATAVQIQRLINDICRNDFSSHSTLMMHADETHHVGANWTVVDEIAVKRITGATSIEKVLQELSLIHI